MFNNNVNNDCNGVPYRTFYDRVPSLFVPFLPFFTGLKVRIFLILASLIPLVTRTSLIGVIFQDFWSWVFNLAPTYSRHLFCHSLLALAPYIGHVTPTHLSLAACITAVTEDSKETIYLYLRISIIIQRGNAISFLHTFDNDDETDTIAVI